LEHRQALIGGRSVETSEAFDDVDPSTGRVIAQVARCGEREIDQAVRAARRTFEDTWRRTTAAVARPRPGQDGRADSARERLPRRAREPGHRQAAAPGVRRRGGRRSLFEFYADTVEAVYGDTVPVAHDLLVYTLLRGHRSHRPVELSAPDRGAHGCARAGRRQLLRSQAGRGGSPDDPAARRARAGGRVPGGSPQRRARVRGGGGRGSRRSSRHRPSRLHRIGRGRPLRGQGRRREHRAGDARAARQVTQCGLRRRRSRRRPAYDRALDHPERGADLLGGLPTARRGRRPRRASRARGRPLRRDQHRPGARGSRFGTAHLARAARRSAAPRGAGQA
jgi:hypothetical protein